jgi:DNA polymerase III subunit gamma/tau
MLGLADRGRIFDLLENVFAGDTKSAIAALDGLHKDGAEPEQVLADLAEAVHAAARCKAVGAEAGAEVMSAEERRRAEALASRLSVAILARAWQMLLKGWEEAGKAPNPRAAAEMVLIRLAHTADLPAPDELLRTLGGDGSVSRARAKEAPRDNGNGRELAPASRVATNAAPPLTDSRDAADEDDLGSESDDFSDAEAGLPSSLPDPRSYEEVIALVGERRDMKLKVHLEDHVSLVKFDAVAGSIDIFLLPGAPPQIANELRERLIAWTQRRWIVMLSKAPGDRPIGEVNREREAAELESLKSHPAFKAVLAEFPDAKIAAVRTLIAPDKDETGTG